MRGCIPLNEEQINKVINVLSLRDRCWFILGIKTGFRISELLSIKISNISADYKQVQVMKKSTKGKVETRILPLHEDASKVLKEYCDHLNRYSIPLVDGAIFVSRKSGHVLDRKSAHRILHGALKEIGAIGLHGQLGTHTMRKSFALSIYHKSNKDLIVTKTLLGHKNINNTISYLPIDEANLFNLMLK